MTEEELWNDLFLAHAEPKQVRAGRELRKRGFVFGTHFGYDNAVERLKAMRQAERDGRLYEHLRLVYGLCQ